MTNPSLPFPSLPPALPQSLIGRNISRALSGSLHGGRNFARSPSQRQLATLAAGAAGRKGASVHSGSEYWRIMRAGAELAAMGESRG